MAATKPVAGKENKKKSLLYLKSDKVQYADDTVKYRCFGKVYSASMVKLSSEVNDESLGSGDKLTLYQSKNFYLQDRANYYNAESEL